jgi:hypothetical protein
MIVQIAAALFVALVAIGLLRIIGEAIAGRGGLGSPLGGESFLTGRESGRWRGRTIANLRSDCTSALFRVRMRAMGPQFCGSCQPQRARLAPTSCDLRTFATPSWLIETPFARTASAIALSGRPSARSRLIS